MGLKADIQAAVAAAKGALGDISVAITYRARTIGAYSAAGASQTITNSDTTCTALGLVGYSLRERAASGGLIQSADQKLLLAAQEIPGVTPKLEDHVLISGTTWSVVDAKKDPADALWIIQLRRP